VGQTCCMSTEVSASAVLPSTAVWSVAADQRAGRPLLVLLHGHGGVEDDLTPIFPLLPASTVAVAPRGTVPLQDRWTWFDFEHQPRVVFDRSVKAVMQWIWLVQLIRSESSASPREGAVALKLLRRAPQGFAYVGLMSAFIMHGRRGSTLN
jgi:phospholipase/carboxylesterase